jgi:hypothetical protein
VKDVQPVDDAQVNVMIGIGHRTTGPRLLARISRRAYETLGFVPGQDVFAQVKAVSLVAAGRSFTVADRAVLENSTEGEATAKLHS